MFSSVIHIRMISEGSWDTEDWCNDAEHSALHHRNKTQFKIYSDRKPLLRIVIIFLNCYELWMTVFIVFEWWKYYPSKCLPDSQQVYPQIITLHFHSNTCRRFVFCCILLSTFRFVELWPTHSNKENICKHDRLSSWLNKVNTNVNASWSALQCNEKVRYVVYFSLFLLYCFVEGVIFY